MYENNDDTLVRALAAAARAFLNTIDDAESVIAAGPQDDDEPFGMDPLNDPAPFRPDPKGSERQRALSGFVYLGGIARINAEHQRGVTSPEISKLARKAGYSGGNAVNGWNSNARAQGSIEVRGADKDRYLNDNGHKLLREYALEIRFRIIGDVTPIDIPEA